MGAAIDLTGEKYGRLTVIHKTNERDKNGSIVWLCMCQCGKTIKTVGSSLKNGNTKSCGCLHREVAGELNKVDIRGCKFGKLTALEPTEDRDQTGSIIWLCSCDCGSCFRASASNLRLNKVKSCGCSMKDSIVENNRFRVDSLIGSVWGWLTVTKIISYAQYHNSEIECSCKCGKTIITRERNLKENEKKSCGCMRKGKNNPNYNPNISDEYRMSDRGGLTRHKEKEWAKNVYERDFWTCQKCNIKTKRLNAHHILSWDVNPDHRYDVSNGITLCKDCHVTFHKTYGYGNNNRSQLDNFLGVSKWKL